MWLLLGLGLRVLWQQWQLWPQSHLQLVVCDVGQGDALLLNLGQQQVLIDTGPDEQVVACLNRYLPFWDKTIDLLVLTHFDADHIGGFAELVQSYQVAYVLLPLVHTQDSELFLEMRELLTTMQQFGTRVKQPILGQQIDLVDFSRVSQAKYNSPLRLNLTFLTPTQLSASQSAVLEENQLFLGQKSETSLSAATWAKLGSSESNNDGSTVVFVQFGSLTLLLTGDLEEPGELALMQLGLITRVNILKAGHHGSKTSTNLRFLQLTRPEVSLISAGKNNKFGHPHAKVVERLTQVGSQIWRTDQLGDLVVHSDGQKFYLRPQKP